MVRGRRHGCLAGRGIVLEAVPGAADDVSVFLDADLARALAVDKRHDASGLEIGPLVRTARADRANRPVGKAREKHLRATEHHRQELALYHLLGPAENGPLHSAATRPAGGRSRL